MPITIKEIESVLSRLAAAPGRFSSALSRLEDADSVASATEGEWSPVEVLAHVRVANDILEPRIFFALVRDNPPLLAYDDIRWAEVARYASVPITESLDAMRMRRKELVLALRALSPEQWERPGVHEVKGQMSVYDLASYIADHDDDHIAQIERGVGNS